MPGIVYGSRVVSSDSRRFWLLIGGATVAIMLGCWLSSGTVAPYGTYDYGDCHYRANGDHYQFSAVYEMLNGKPYQVWGYSVVLRRVLHPALAFPFIKMFGYDAGGLIFNILLHGAMMIGFALAIRRYFDARASVLVCWLLASYPGYAYWAGLPYSYAIIVPGSIGCAIGLLWWNDAPSIKRTAVTACVIGVIGTGYDLMPFFGGSLVLLILHKRRWRDLPVALALLGGWAMFVSKGLPAIYGFKSTNTNTKVYGVVIKTWLRFWEHVEGWGALLRDLPHVFVSNFFFSAGIFLPILFLVLIALNVRNRQRPILGAIPTTISIATLGVWAFLNVAPPYGNWWQLRGTWMARLYQPWFVVILLAVAAATIALRETRSYKLLVGSIVACCLAGWLAIAGPYVRLYAVYMAVHQNFYQHESLRSNWKWMHQLGVRPYGFCKK
jgi:hypothetical protein